MAYLNQVNLIGNVGNDPEIRTIESGAKFATFKVATTERYKDRDGNQKEQTQWHPCVASGPIADVCEKYLKKGAAVYIGGKLTYRQWEDKDGGKHNTTEVRVFTVQMLDRKPKNAPDTITAQENHPEDLPF